MLKIRLFRVGKKNQPVFKIVATDKRRPAKAGRFKEQLGFYNPLTKERVLKAERIKYWLSVGAQPSDTVHNLLVSEKIIQGKKLSVHKKTKKKKEPDAAKSTEKPAEKAAVPAKQAETEKPLQEQEKQKPQVQPVKENSVSTPTPTPSLPESAKAPEPAQKSKEQSKQEPELKPEPENKE